MIVTAILAVAVIAPVIPAVHVHGNPTLALIEVDRFPVHAHGEITARPRR